MSPCPLEDDFFSVSVHSTAEGETEVMEVRGHELLAGGPHQDMRNVVLLLPGNPGLVLFYTKFLRALHGLIPPGTGMLSIGYCGHSLVDWNRGRAFSVQQQENAVVEISTRILAAAPEAQLHILGHSVGGWLSLRVADRLPHARIGTIVGLFPTVHHIGSTPNARMGYALLPGTRNVVAGLGGIFGLLPLGFRRAVVGCADPKVGAGGFQGVVARMGRYGLLHNIFYMARTEFLAILDVDPDLLNRFRDRLVMYYGETDGWVPSEHRTVVEEHLGVSSQAACDAVKYPAVVRDATNSPHAFCLTHNQEVADSVAPMLRLV